MASEPIRKLRRRLESRTGLRLSWQEWALGEIALACLMRCARLARARGDRHEWLHIAAAVGAGASYHAKHGDTCIAQSIMDQLVVARDRETAREVLAEIEAGEWRDAPACHICGISVKKRGGPWCSAAHGRIEDAADR